jgi:hypothetical protein
MDFFSAIITLGGIPGFGTEAITLEGVGSARVKVDYTASGYIESQLDKIGDIDSVEDLKTYIQYIESIYEVSDLNATVDNTMGYVLDYLVPESLQNNNVYKYIKTNLLNWKFSSLFSIENDIITDVPLVGVINVSGWAREKINGFLSSNSEIINKLQDALVDVVTKIEDSYRENIDAENADAKRIAEEYAKSNALLIARSAAKSEADAALDVINAAEVAQLNSGIPGALIKILNTDLCKQKFEEHNLGQVYEALVKITEYAESYVQYTASSYEYPADATVLDSEIVYE